jgi:type 1 glutamine amidotransferase
MRLFAKVLQVESRASARKGAWLSRMVLLLFTLLSAQTEFRAAAADPVRIVLISGEPEYFSSNSLPAFAKLLETNYHFRCAYLERTDSNNIPGLEALEKADLAILFVRRMTLPEEQIGRVRKFLDSGKPLIGLRTASHAFENWKSWDHDVLGGNYHMHHGNQLRATARVIPGAREHPILRNVAAEFDTGGSLYKTSPLAEGATVLLMGSVDGQPPEPMAWTHNYKEARVFYTSLGHPNDFENPSFKNLVVNAVFWCLRQERPPSVDPAK